MHIHILVRECYHSGGRYGMHSIEEIYPCFMAHIINCFISAAESGNNQNMRWPSTLAPEPPAAPNHSANQLQEGCGYMDMGGTGEITNNQPCQRRLTQATTPQRMVGIIGSVWQESTPSKETTGPAQTNTQSETAMNTNSRKRQTAHARPLLEPAGFSQLVLVLTSNSDCCYHRLSVATVLRSYSCQRPLAEKAAG